MSRANVSESERPDATGIDEIASYLADENTTIAENLAELRKYRVSYNLASRLLVSQLDEAKGPAVLGIIGSLVAMTIGPTYAELVAPLIGQQTEPAQLVAIPRIAARLLAECSSHAATFRTIRGARIKKVAALPASPLGCPVGQSLQIFRYYCDKVRGPRLSTPSRECEVRLTRKQASKPQEAIKSPAIL